MKKIFSAAVLTLCIATFTAGCGGQETAQTTPTQAAEEQTTEDTRHVHEWTYMENDSESWEECEECGAKKNIQELATEATTEAATTATTEATTEATTQAAAATTQATTEKKKKTNKTKSRDDYKTDHDYEWYMRNGKGGEKFSYTMTVLQTVEEGVYLCDLGTDYSGNMVFVYMDLDDYTKELTGGQRIIEDDTIRVYGTFEKTYIYETANGGSKESLVVKAAYIDIQ